MKKNKTGNNCSSGRCLDLFIITHTPSHVCPEMVYVWIITGCVTCPLGPPDGPQTVHMLIPKLNDPSAQ